MKDFEYTITLSLSGSKLSSDIKGLMDKLSSNLVSFGVPEFAGQLDVTFDYPMVLTTGRELTKKEIDEMIPIIEDGYKKFKGRVKSFRIRDSSNGLRANI